VNKIVKLWGKGAFDRPGLFPGVLPKSKIKDEEHFKNVFEKNKEQRFPYQGIPAKNELWNSLFSSHNRGSRCLHRAIQVGSESSERPPPGTGEEVFEFRTDSGADLLLQFSCEEIAIRVTFFPKQL
jgi:hypothetical protein